VIEEPNLDLPVIRILAVWEKLLLMHSHFLSPRRMADLFSARAATVQVHFIEGTAWVLVEK